MRKANKMMVLKDERNTVTYKRLKGRRTLKFYRDSWDSLNHVTHIQFIVIGLFSNDHNKEITYVCRTKDDTQDFTNVYHSKLSWRRLKKKFISDYKKSGYERFY